MLINFKKIDLFLHKLDLNKSHFSKTVAVNLCLSYIRASAICINLHLALTLCKLLPFALS